MSLGGIYSSLLSQALFSQVLPFLFSMEPTAKLTIPSCLLGYWLESGSCNNSEQHCTQILHMRAFFNLVPIFDSMVLSGVTGKIVMTYSKFS